MTDAPTSLAPDEALAGGCRCGRLRYRVVGEPQAVNCCHCRDCQRITGSAFAVNAAFPTSQVELRPRVERARPADRQRRGPGMAVFQMRRASFRRPPGIRRRSAFRSRRHLGYWGAADSGHPLLYPQQASLGRYSGRHSGLGDAAHAQQCSYRNETGSPAIPVLPGLYSKRKSGRDMDSRPWCAVPCPRPCSPSSRVRFESHGSFQHPSA